MKSIKHSQIIETNVKWGSKDSEFIAQHFIPSARDIQDASSIYGRFIYIDKKPLIVITSTLVCYYGARPKHSLNFVQLLNYKRSLNYYDCLLLSTLYYFESKATIRKILTTHRAKKNEATINKYLFFETNGYLVYDYQFEQLAESILEIDKNQARDLCKQFNKKKESLEKWNGSRELMLKFKKLLKGHFVTENVYHPNFVGGKRLMEFYGKSTF